MSGLIIGVTASQITAPPIPTGGTIVDSGGYRYHVFTASSSFVVPVTRTVEYVVVGGGGSSQNGGGGAGGYLSGSLSANGTYTITIGAGGGPDGGFGSNSSAFGVNAIAGGRGGFGSNGGNGGSGGGGAHYSNYSAAGGSGTSGQGNAGGSKSTSVSEFAGGGGGGAGAAGQSITSYSTYGNGGNGSNAHSAWLVATNTGTLHSGTRYLAGGGNGQLFGEVFGEAGFGGAVNQGNGLANTGAGGGAFFSQGGSGIVIVRYVF